MVNGCNGGWDGKTLQAVCPAGSETAPDGSGACSPSSPSCTILPSALIGSEVVDAALESRQLVASN